MLNTGFAKMVINHEHIVWCLEKSEHSDVI